MHRWLFALRRFILHRWTRYVLCWLLALALSALELHIAWYMFDNPQPDDPKTARRDGNRGHTLIDFGGQWLIANMFATGHGHELYSLAAQRQVLVAAYPESDQPPASNENDAKNLINWLVEVPSEAPVEADVGVHKNAASSGPKQVPIEAAGQASIGGPLYPPTHALMFAPLGSLPPQRAYRVAQVVFLLCGWVAGLGAAGISRHRIWWPAATMLIMVFPGFGPSLHLAQNSALSLAMVMVGWWLVSRRWDVAGGIVWGLLAYKPVWAVAFLLVPLLTRRWRMLFAMIVSGLAFVLATLPFVGIEAWWNWFRIGREAAALYKVDENWIFLSRDLMGIPRRWMQDFTQPMELRNRWQATAAGWIIWATVLSATAGVALLRRRAVRQADGYGAAFVAIGAWAACFHFIYYDSLLAAFPVVLLLTEPRRFLRPVLLAAAPAPRRFAAYFSPRPIVDLPPPAALMTSPRMTAVLNSFVLTAVVLLIFIEQAFNNLNLRVSLSLGRCPDWLAGESGGSGGLLISPLKFATNQSGTPWDTFVMIALWAYCGARILLAIGEGTAEKSPDCPRSPTD